MVMSKFKVTLSTPKSLSDSELEVLSEAVEELDLEQKVYGIIRELIRERIDSKYELSVEVE